MDRLLLIDANNLINRHYHATPKYHAPDGTPTGAIGGWIKSLLALQETYQPVLTIAAFDQGCDPERREIVPEYKGNRKEKDQDLVTQLDLIRDQICPLMGIPVIHGEKVEADDILHTLILLWSGPSLLASGDKDMVQCVSPTCSLLRPGKAKPWEEFGEGNAHEILGVTPVQVPDYLALVGDSSDNIPGLKGVGEKTASTWFQTFSSLEDLRTRITEIKPERFQEKIRAEYPRLLNIREVTRLKTLPQIQLPEAIPTRTPELKDLIQKWGIKSVLRKLSDGGPVSIQGNLF